MIFRLFLIGKFGFFYFIIFQMNNCKFVLLQTGNNYSFNNIDFRNMNCVLRVRNRNINIIRRIINLRTFRYIKLCLNNLILKSKQYSKNYCTNLYKVNKIFVEFSQPAMFTKQHGKVIRDVFLKGYENQRIGYAYNRSLLFFVF